MMKIEGYTLLQEDDLPGCQSVGRLFRHRSGAMVYHFANEDRENSFCFGFSTPVRDSKGTPHILEHTVLTGSEKFPLKEPFINLAKGSVNTFLNAMTYPDKTLYPSASVVKADFFNLLDVYGDAVFFPLLRRECFAQEGHHLEFSEEGALQRSGVVYNEMKGVYSSLDDCAGDFAQRVLFERHPYAYESGGDPAEIPRLTYEEFCDFHRQHYCPKNCVLILYGDIPPEESLLFVHQRFFSRFPDSDTEYARVPLMPFRGNPVRLRRVVPVPTEGDEQGVLFVSWLLPEVTESRMLYALMLLEEVLLGHDASPLRDALMRSKLGEAVSSYSGLVSHLRQPIFLCGLRGSEESKLSAMVELLERVLADLVRDGVDEELLRGALQRLEFRQREIRSGFPKGLRLTTSVLRGWFYGQSAFDAVEFDQSFAWVREQPASYFSNLIRDLLLDNRHRGELYVCSNREGEPWDEYLPNVLAPKLEEEIRSLHAKLTRLQREPDPPEVVARLKFLGRGEIPCGITPLRGSYGKSGRVEWSRHEIFTKGIRYLSLSFDFSHLGLDDLALLPFFSEGITELGLPEKSYQQVLRELILSSGRCHARASNYPLLGGGTMRSRCTLAAAFLPRQRDALYALLEKLLRCSHWDNVERVSQLLDTAVNEMRESLIPRGHGFAMLRAQSHLSRLVAVEERQRGLDQIRSLVDWKGALPEVLIERMKRLQRWLHDAPLTISLAGEGVDWEADLRWAENLSGKSAIDAIPANDFAVRSPQEGFAIPAQVGYVGVSLPGVGYQHPLSPAMSVLAHCLSTAYLWEKVRMEGGAYGGGAAQSGLGSHFSFYSYRDPKFERSLDLFADGLESARSIGSGQVENAVVVLAGRDLRPLAPAEEAGDALRYHQMGLTDDMRQQWRDRLLSVQPEHVRAAAELLLQRWPERSVCVLAPGGRLRKMKLDTVEELPL